MEFSDLGSHCSLKECNRQDYLPFQCKYCHEFYCLEHRTEIDHNCSKYEETTRTKIKKKKEVKHTCIVCKKDTKIEMKCFMCQKNTCLAHRHYHTCLKRLEKKDNSIKNWFCWN